LLLVDRQGRVLLQKRPGTGVWASLWSLPESPDERAAREWLQLAFGGAPGAGAETLAPIEHGFTHFQLRLQPLRWAGVAMRPRLADNDGLRWAARDEWSSLGIPAPIRRLLEESIA
jgi:A/G-specific adenine glycosylase